MQIYVMIIKDAKEYLVNERQKHKKKEHLLINSRKKNTKTPTNLN